MAALRLFVGLKTKLQGASFFVGRGFSSTFLMLLADICRLFVGLKTNLQGASFFVGSSFSSTFLMLLADIYRLFVGLKSNLQGVSFFVGRGFSSTFCVCSYKADLFYCHSLLNRLYILLLKPFWHLICI